MRVPFSLTRQVNEGDLRLPERAAFADAFLADYRLGAALSGDLGELIYQAAVMSPDPVLDSQLFDHGVLVAGRLVAEPLGPVGLTPWRRAESDPWYGWFRFAAGLSVLYGTLAAPRTLALDPELTAAVAIARRHRRVSVFGALRRRRGEPSPEAPSRARRSSPASPG